MFVGPESGHVKAFDLVQFALSRLKVCQDEQVVGILRGFEDDRMIYWFWRMSSILGTCGSGWPLRDIGQPTRLFRQRHQEHQRTGRL